MPPPRCSAWPRAAPAALATGPSPRNLPRIAAYRPPGRAGRKQSPTARPNRCFSPRTGRSQVAGRNLLISSSTDITEQKAFEDHLFRSAYYDELTGLPTRRVIEHRVNSLLKQDNGQGRFALAFLDVDNFKHINDYYGHAVGDALLVEMAKRLGLDLRESDILSRISGDEFVLLLNPIQSARRSRSSSTSSCSG